MKKDKITEFFNDVCKITENMGTCDNPSNHKYVVSKRVKTKLNEICNVSKEKNTIDGILNFFEGSIKSVDWIKRNIAPCNVPDKKKYPYRGNIYTELDGLAWGGGQVLRCLGREKL